MTNLDTLENASLQLLLKGDDPVLEALRNQVIHIISREREFTGVGYYVHFALADNAPRLPNEPSFGFGDVVADIDGLEFGVAIQLWVERGRLACLEVVTYDETWPVEIGAFSIRYEKAPRDLDALRATTNWPRFISFR